MNIFKKGAFSYDPNMTPQQLADKRAMLALLQPKYGKASYIGEGLGQLATGVATGIRTRKLDEIEGKGREQGANLFSGLFGNATQSTSGQSGPMNILGVDPGYSAPPSEGAAVADDTMAALGKTPMRPYRDAIAGIESAGSGDYGAIGPTHPKMGRAMGRYQIMESNIGPWSLAALGREVTPDEFMANPQIQDAIFDHVFGGYVDQYGPEGAAQAWFAGPGGVGKTDRKDVLGTTVGDYGKMFTANLGGPVAAPAGASTATNSAMPFIDPQALITALANPWLSPEERSVLTTIYDQQVQAGDPLRQIEVAKGMAELKKGSKAPAAFASLDLQAKAAGFEPGTPEYQEFMRNGGGSGTPAAFTALDLQAKAAGFEPGTPQYQEFMATRGAGFIAAAKAKGEDAATAESLESKMPGLEEVVRKLDELSEKATYTYGGQALDWSQKQLGMDPRAAAVARSEYIAMVDNQVLPLLRDTFGAQFTQAEGETLRNTLGDPDKSPTEKQAVLKAFIEQKRRDLEALNVRTGRDAAPAAGGGLQPGAIEDGFRFKGGDPSDPANWEQVQ